MFFPVAPEGSGGKYGESGLFAEAAPSKNNDSLSLAFKSSGVSVTTSEVALGLISELTRRKDERLDEASTVTIDLEEGRFGNSCWS